MAVLVLRLAGPLQSWGITSKFNTRESGTEPSKSGVIGMIASAMGRRRTDSIEDLAALRFGVRKDQEGRIIEDFHMAHIPEGAHNKVNSYLTHRYYISDAIFLAALEGDRKMLEKIEEAIKSPVFPLYLGRRSCPPSGRVSMGIVEGNLEEVLNGFEWQANEWYRKRMNEEVRLEIVVDSDGGDEQLDDVPISFDQSKRTYRRRFVERKIMKEGIVNPQKLRRTDHDAMAELNSEGTP